MAEAGTVIAVAEQRPGWFQLELQLDEAVDVVTSDRFSNLRARVRGVVGPEGHSQQRTSDGPADSDQSFVVNAFKGGSETILSTAALLHFSRAKVRLVANDTTIHSLTGTSDSQNQSFSPSAASNLEKRRQCRQRSYIWTTCQARNESHLNLSQRVQI